MYTLFEEIFNDNILYDLDLQPTFWNCKIAYVMGVLVFHKHFLFYLLQSG